MVNARDADTASRKAADARLVSPSDHCRVRLSAFLLPVALSTFAQARRVKRTLTIVILSVGSFLVILGLTARLTEVTIGDLTRDPAALADVPVYLGMVSHLGVILWAAAVSVCGFSSVLIHRLRSRTRLVHFLAAAAILSGILMLDDLFMFHERVLPERLGVAEPLIYLSYVALVAAFLLWFAQLILQTDFLLLGSALISFGLSVFLDLIPSDRLGLAGSYLIEDGFKLLGIALWLTYFTRVGLVGTLTLDATKAVPVDAV
jgi:hypothetical protein